MTGANEQAEPQPPPPEGESLQGKAPVLYLRGTHREMGKAHAAQVAHLRQSLLSVIASQLDELQKTPRAGPRLRALWEAWNLHARPLVDMLEGLAEGLSLEPWTLFQYLGATYVLELEGYSAPAIPECTVWAADVREGNTLQTVLCKNRDYRPQHVHLEVVVLAEPAQGYRYGYISSAGSPGVFSSGINERGLAVADTRVRTPDQGPGTPRYALMMEVLEHHDSVASALDYLLSVPHMGGGTLTLADAQGEKAVVEMTHSTQRIAARTQTLGGWVVSTNHFVHPDLADRWVDPSPPHLRGNSLARRAVVERKLGQEGGPPSLADMAPLMAHHEGPLASLCRHEGLDKESRTVSGTVFFPTKAAFLFCHGYPCQGAFLPFQVQPRESSG